MVEVAEPFVDEDGAPFWEYAARGELRVQACGACGRWRFPPRPCCPYCRSFERSWEPVSGRGRIWSFVVAHPPLLPPFDERAPYPVLVVELAEDPRLRMVGDLVAPQKGRRGAREPRIGAAVQVAFDKSPAGVMLPRWVLI